MLQSSRMDESRIVTPRRARQIALAASVGAHALVAGLWLHAAPHKAPADTAGRSRAAITVRLYSVPVPTVAPAARVEAQFVVTQPMHTAAPRKRMAAVPTLKSQQQQLPQQQPEPQPPPEKVAVVTPPPPAAPSPARPDNAPPAAVPGAAFAGLFTPILSRPMGNGGWGRRSTTPAPTPSPAPDAHAQREQALLALQSALLGRLNDLAGRLRSSGQDVQCHIAIDGPRQTAEVKCADPADQGAPWSALQGLLVAGTVPTGSASLCFRLAGPQVSPATCAEIPEPPSP